MNEVMMVHMSREELKQEILSIVKPSNSVIPAKNRLVNRDFLKVNYKWSKYKVNKLIANGRLKRADTTNGKTDYFWLFDCERIREEELKF